MNYNASQTIDRSLVSASGGVRLVDQGALVRDRTAAIDRFLLVATGVLLPLEFHVSSIAGFSIMYIMFGALGGYILLSRPHTLARISRHPVFLAAYALLGLGFLIESLHSNSSYFDLKRYGYMIAGAIAIASLCRDQRALQTGLYSYLVTGIWLSVFLILNFHDSFSGATVTDLHEASKIRAEVFAENPLIVNLNAVSFQITQGLVVAFAFALTANSWIRRSLFLSLALLCSVSTFLPMSRGGIMIAIVSCVIIVFVYRGKRIKVLIMVAILGMGILTWVPDAAIIRLSSSITPSYYRDKADGRAHIYTAAFEHLPEYMVTGVGAGNFWKWWGDANGFGSVGAHNCFLQVTIFWGVAGFFALLIVVWRAYRCLPKHCGADALSLCLLGIAVSLLLFMLVVHNLYDKQFSLGLGMLIGARRWIWPNGIVQPELRTKVAPSHHGYVSQTAPSP
jgi:hypothetical protein